MVLVLRLVYIHEELTRSSFASTFVANITSVGEIQLLMNGDGDVRLNLPTSYVSGSSASSCGPILSMGEIPEQSVGRK